jgi:RNA ligase (TIGR02306 family)
MERKLASVQRIVSLTPIEGADKIVKASVLGWELVVAVKDNFKVGDLCVFCEVDSIMPDKPEFEFLRERKFRIKTIKLKGQVSQGICFPISIVHKAFHTEGRDVTEILGVTKYDPQAEFERKETLRLASIDKNRMTKFLKRYSWYRNLFFKPT